MSRLGDKYDKSTARSSAANFVQLFVIFKGSLLEHQEVLRSGKKLLNMDMHTHLNVEVRVSQSIVRDVIPEVTLGDKTEKFLQLPISSTSSPRESMINEQK